MTELPSQEQVMDKKIFSPPPKAAPLLDSSRQRQDVAGGNHVPKNQSKSQFRRRETPAGAGSSNVQGFKQDVYTSRKPAPQKSKALDKRPRPRSFYSQEQVADRDEAPEYGSLQSPGSKKQNMNHLLNFYFAPRENRGADSKSFVHQGSSSHGRTKFLKEGFIQANCQFMLERSTQLENVGVYKYDPDLLVNWKSIEQIMIRTYGETPVCPICLSPPCAGKMTRCGHIFCWPCILHYLSYAEKKKSQPCPICYEPVTQKDLKSVVANICQEFHTGDTIEMQLMCRPKDSSAVEMPLVCKLGETIEWERRFKKLILISLSEVMTEILNREYDELLHRDAEVVARGIEELEAGYSQSVVSLESEFVTAAKDEWELRRQLVEHNIEAQKKLNLEKTKLEMISGANATTKTDKDKTSNVFAKQDLNAVSSSGCIGELGPTSPEFFHAEDDFDREQFLKDENMNSYHCFYQAADGRNAFLNPLNMAMLWKSFGEVPRTWPQRVEFRILEIEYLTMTPELRKRFKFLQHVPVNTCVQLVEVELKPPMITEEVMRDFAAQISQRKRRRSDRVRQEKHRERRQLEAERRQQPRHPKIESILDFPSCGAVGEDFQGLEQAIQASLTLGTLEPPGKHYHDQESDVEYQESESGHTRGIEITRPSHAVGNHGFPVPMSTSPSMSFAQACTASPPSRPIWKKSPTYPLTTGAKSGQSLRRVASEAEAEDGSTVPEFSISDAIAHALANVNPNAEGDSAGNGQKKKGRKKGKLLFATGMEMGNN